MTHEEKISYMRIAGGIVGYVLEQKHADMLVSIYELVIEKQGELDLNTITATECAVNDRDNQRKKQKLLDSVSDKA